MDGSSFKDGLPTAEEVLKAKVPSALYNSGNCYVGHALDTMQEYSDHQNAELLERVKELEALMQEFVDRVDRGEVRSKRTYAKFKEALKK